MLKIHSHKQKNILNMAFFGLIVIGCSFLVGCQTISPEVLAERNHRIKEINAKLFDNMQILLSYARQENIDLEQANKALDGVFLIIGHPDSQEVLLSKVLDEEAIKAIITHSIDLKKERMQLVKDNERDAVVVNKNFHEFKESHETLLQLKWFAGILLFVGAICLFIFKPKIF